MAMAKNATPKRAMKKIQTVQFDLSDLDEGDVFMNAVLTFAAAADPKVIENEAPTVPKVMLFSATMAKERDQLGDRVTEWLRRNPQFELTELRTMQSSDESFHCVTFVLIGTELR